MENIQKLLIETKAAAFSINNLSIEKRQAILRQMALLLREKKEIILSENKKDLDRMTDSDPKKDRLLLTEERLEEMAKSIEEVSQLPDPTGVVQLDRVLENGLKLTKISAALGVVGVIYEARPNVTIDVAALSLYAGSAVVLRGGSDAEISNEVLVKEVIHEALLRNGLKKEAVALLPVDRKFVKELLEAEDYVDIIIPRGSQNLIQFVKANAKVPIIETGAGVCHTYVENTADLQKAANIVINAKTQRPSVCNSLDTIVVDEVISSEFLPLLLNGFNEFDVEVFADEKSYSILTEVGYGNLKKASSSDFGREFLGQKCSIKTVKGLEEAIQHIATHSSKHSEAIVTEDQEKAETFLKQVDAAAVYHNASTRFTDGAVFGLGAEIGISTQKLHARGPFALEKLTTEKWIIRGEGQIR